MIRYPALYCDADDQFTAFGGIATNKGDAAVMSAGSQSAGKVFKPRRLVVGQGKAKQKRLWSGTHRSQITDGTTQGSLGNQVSWSCSRKVDVGHLRVQRLDQQMASRR